MTSTDDLPQSDLLNQRSDLIRLAALEKISPSKLSLNQALELAELHEHYGELYHRQLAEAMGRFKQVLAGPRFQLLREFPPQAEFERVIDDLGEFRLPERIGTMTPTQAMQIRADITNRLVTASSLRRHAERNANALEAKVKLAEELWMGLSPADREWRMLGELADVMDPLREKAREVRALASSADVVYWQLKIMLETVQHMMYDWDRNAGMGGVRGGRGVVDQVEPTRKSDDFG